MIETSHTREQQLEVLRKMGRGQLLQHAEIVAWSTVAVLVVLGFWKSWVPCYMGAAFLAIVAASSRATFRNVRNAVRGDREGVRVRGKADIAFNPDTDMPSYFLTTHDRGVQWKMEFVAGGWKPAEGSFAAELVYIRGVEWPVLVVLEAGIVVPRYDPVRV